MRIGFITPGFSANIHDWAIPVLQNIVTGLARSHEVQVFTLRYPHTKGAYRVANAPVESLGGATRGGLRRIPLLLNALASVRRAHRQNPFDVLHAFWLDEPAFIATWASRSLRIPVVASLMGGELVSFRELGYGGQLSLINRLLTHYSLAHAQVVTAGSSLMANLAKNRFKRQSVELLPLGVDTRLFRPPLQLPSDRIGSALQLAMVASLVPIKDHMTLLEAISRLHMTGYSFHLDIVGKGPLEPELRAWLSDRRLSEQVTWRGAISYTEMPNCYHRSDLLVVSSRFESQSLVLLEAGACGVPVIGTAVGALPDLLPPSLLISPADSDGLAERIAVLADRPAARRDAGQLLHQKVQEGFTLEHTLARLESIYWDLHH